MPLGHRSPLLGKLVQEMVVIGGQRQRRPVPDQADDDATMLLGETGSLKGEAEVLPLQRRVGCDLLLFRLGRRSRG